MQMPSKKPIFFTTVLWRWDWPLPYPWHHVLSNSPSWSRDQQPKKERVVSGMLLSWRNDEENVSATNQGYDWLNKDK